MALKPTIHKFSISLSDLDREVYDSLNLTVAQHPSESAERMLVRVMAFCLNAQEGLSFTRGLSDTEEPDIWLKSLDNQIELWVEVGEPGIDRLKKATRQSGRTLVYSFNSKSSTWWNQLNLQRSGLAVEVFAFNTEEVSVLSKLLTRTMKMSVTITGQSAYVATDQGECEVSWQQLS